MPAAGWADNGRRALPGAGGCAGIWSPCAAAGQGWARGPPEALQPASWRCAYGHPDVHAQQPNKGLQCQQQHSSQTKGAAGPAGTNP